MGTNAVVLGLAIAALRIVGLGGETSTATSRGDNLASAGSEAAVRSRGAVLPKDPCALLKTAEIQTLAPKAILGSGVSSTLPGSMGSVACEYKLGTGRPATSLQVILSEASKMFPGMSPALIKQGLLRGVNAGNANTAVIAGVGDAAIYQSDEPIRAKATAYVKGFLLDIAFEGPDARGKKDQVIALLKSATARL